MSTKRLIKVNVQNDRSLNKLGIITVYMTPEVKTALGGEITNSGESLYSLFKKGRALRGFKHLIEKIREKEPKSRIVFTHNKTKKVDGKILINYDDYKKAAGKKFFLFYRETGLDAASYFLNQHFPQDFSHDNAGISENDVKKIDKNFQHVMERVPKKKKNKKAIIDESSKIISELSAKKKFLTQEVADLDRLRNASNIFFFQNKIEELKTRLTKKYPETKGNNSWQSWIYDNNWLFGINYQSPIEKQKINIAGSMPDYLFPTMDGFLDILEIKLPSKDIIIKDPDHKGAYVWSSHTNKAIGQVVTYISDIELYQLHLREEIKKEYNQDIHLVKPRAFILVGKKDGWSKEEHKALRKLNYSLHGIEVTSYTDLLQKGEDIVKNYTKKYSFSSQVDK